MDKIKYVKDRPVFKECDIDEDMRVYTHYANPSYDGFTLCSLAWDDQPAVKARDKVDCPECLKIVRACKKVRL